MQTSGGTLEIELCGQLITRKLIDDGVHFDGGS